MKVHIWGGGGVGLRLDSKILTEIKQPKEAEEKREETKI